jgi:hypothetical protein
MSACGIIIRVKTDEEVKAKRKAYRQTSEYKAKAKEHNQKYRSRPEVRARRKAQQASSEYKAYQKEYQSRPEVKTREKSRRERPEEMAHRRAYQKNPNVKRNMKIARDGNRLKVLEYYSKLHCNSDIPCCRCCGLNSHIGFLSLDHILGRKPMDSIPELIAIKYSSKYKTHQLSAWIIDNNYLSNLKTEYFQILCQNCNFAKGHSKDNECPLKNKPHF